MDHEQIFTDAAAKLRQTVLQGRTFDAAQVSVIGLDEIKREAGDHWPKISDRVRINALNFLQGCLAADDIVIPCGAVFLVIYAALGARDLSAHCAELQKMLNSFYLGDALTAALHSEVSPKQMSAASVAGMLRDAAGDAPPAALQGAPLAHEIRLKPVWSVACQAVGVYFASPFYWRGGARHFGYSPNYRETGAHEDEDFTELDLAGLQHVVSALEAARGAPHVGVVAFSVHATTMARRASRQAFLSALAAVPDDIRRLMPGRVAEIELGAPVVTLADWTHQLRPFASRIALELHPRERAPAGFEGVGAWCVSCAVPESAQTPAMQARTLATMRVWRNHAQRQALKLAFTGLASPDIVHGASALGADFLASERIWRSVERPAGVHAFSSEDLRRAAAQLSPVSEKRLIRAS